MWKKLTAVATVAAGMLIGSVVPADASNKPDKTEVSFPVSWTILSANCTQIPDGWVDGSGTMTGLITTRVGRDGVIHQRFDFHAEGSASDQDGNTYVFRYDNFSNVQNSLEQPDVYSGLMVDYFSLRGDGPASMFNGFTADFVEDRGAGTFAVTPRSVRGDPFAFPSGGGRCDPL